VSLIHASSPRCGGGSPLDTLAALMEAAASSRPVGRFVPAAVVANGDAYFDARGPLRAD
jgi:hypothetical protein